MTQRTARPESQPETFQLASSPTEHASLSGSISSESSEPPVVIDLTPALLPANVAVDTALTTAARRVIGWWKTPQDPLRFSEILDNNRALSGSQSLGQPRNGSVLNSAELAFTGPHYSIIERHRARNTRFGTDQMIELIHYSAARVDEQFPGSILRVGNIGYKRGGKIPWSVTHNSGRDADLAFYVKRIDDGAHIPSPDLLHIDESGIAISHRDLQFDVERNWILVKALLTHPEIHTQWLFISEPLKQMLLAHALELGEDPDLIERASQILHQPTESLPHDDHLHLRITCSKRDRLEGCLDPGPFWPWIDWHDQDLFARSLELMRALDAPQPETRLAALNFLEKIRSPYAPEVALVRGIHDADPRVRQKALEVARAIPSWSATAIRAAQQFIAASGTTLDEQKIAYEILRRSSDALVSDFIFTRLHDPATSVDEQILAARALSHIMEPELVPRIIERFAHHDAPVRQELAQVLHRITNHAPPAAKNIDWTRNDEAALASGIEFWNEWWQQNRNLDRQQWLINGFVSHGLEPYENTLSLASADHLIQLLRKQPDHIVYNANRTLQALTRRWAPLEETNGNKLHRHWAPWWNKNRSRLLHNAVSVR